jgi:hypothetical protein
MNALGLSLRGANDRIDRATGGLVEVVSGEGETENQSYERFHVWPFVRCAGLKCRLGAMQIPMSSMRIDFGVSRTGWHGALCGVRLSYPLVRKSVGFR